MNLDEIREIKTKDRLQEAIDFLCANLKRMTYGEMHAMSRCIQSVAYCTLEMDFFELTEMEKIGHERSKRTGP